MSTGGAMLLGIIIGWVGSTVPVLMIIAYVHVGTKRKRAAINK